MKKQALFIGIILITCLLTACTSFIVTDLAVIDAPNAKIIGHFREEISVNKFLGSSGGYNLGNFSATNGSDYVYDAVMAQVLNNGGSGAINVTVEYRASFMNILLNSITSNIWAPSTIIVEGDVIR